MVSADFPFSRNLLIVLIGLLINLQESEAFSNQKHGCTLVRCINGTYQRKP